MANRRSLHRKISLNSELSELSALACLAFTWGIAHTDDWGVLSGEPRVFKAAVLPLRRESVGQVAKAIDDLVEAGLLFRWSEDGKPYLWYPAFDVHQDGLQRRTRSRTEFPLPPGHHLRSEGPASGSSGQSPEIPASSEKFTEIQGNSDLARAGGSEVKGSEGKGSEKDLSAASQADLFGEPETKKPERLDDPYQEAANACLAVWGLTHDQVPNYGKYIKAIKAIIKQRAGGVDEVKAWALAEKRAAVRALGQGAEAEIAIPPVVRREITTSEWQASWNKQRANKPGPRRGPSPPSAFGKAVTKEEWAAMTPEQQEAAIQARMSGRG